MAKNFWNSFVRDQSGQSLMEIIVGLTIGAILIGTASFGISFMLRSTTTNQNLSTAAQLTQGLLSNIQSFSNSSWQNIYGLGKTSSYQYFLSASGTSYIAVQGQEGLVDNDVTNGLLAEWKLDEATGTMAYDATGNNKTGALNSGPVRTTSTCKMGYCLGFDGTSQSVTVPILNPSSVTVSAWFNRTSMDTVNADAIFGGWYWNSDTQLRQGFDLRFYINDPKLNWEVETTNGSTVTEKGIYSGNLSTSTLYHAVATYDSASGIASIYINGALANQSTASPGNTIVPQTQYTDMRIGYSRVNGGYFPGYIDDVRIYNRALSASEVKQLYNSQVFTRYFYVDNVCRTNDSSGNISSSTPPCSGGLMNDPLTQKVTAVTNWIFGASPDQVSLARYVTRWNNFSIRQSDWSGGAGQNGSITIPNNQYSSSTNITPTSTFGSFQILNLSQ